MSKDMEPMRTGTVLYRRDVIKIRDKHGDVYCIHRTYDPGIDDDPLENMAYKPVPKPWKLKDCPRCRRPLYRWVGQKPKEFIAEQIDLRREI